MTRNVIITPTTLMRKTAMSMQYSVPNSDILRVLTPDFRILEYSTSQFLSATKESPYPMEYTKDIPFDIASNQQMQFKFGFETKLSESGHEEGIDTSNSNKKKALEIFFFEHPQTVKNGKPHKFTKAPLFNVIDMALQTINENIDFEQQMSISNKIMFEMDFAQRQNLSYYFGRSPLGLADAQLKP